MGKYGPPSSPSPRQDKVACQQSGSRETSNPATVTQSCGSFQRREPPCRRQIGSRRGQVDCGKVGAKPSQVGKVGAKPEDPAKLSAKPARTDLRTIRAKSNNPETLGANPARTNPRKVTAKSVIADSGKGGVKPAQAGKVSTQYKKSVKVGSMPTQVNSAKTGVTKTKSQGQNQGVAKTKSRQLGSTSSSIYSNLRRTISMSQSRQSDHSAKTCLSRQSTAPPQHWAMSEATMQCRPNIVAIPFRTELFESFRNVLNTDKPGQLNVGRDVKEKGEYTMLDLVGAWRIENGVVWNAYANERNRIRNELKAHNVTAPHFYMRRGLFNAIKNLPGVDQMYADCNETYLIHGTAAHGLPNIFRNGMAPPHWECEALFGKGIYFAEDSCKNDQYGVGDTGRSNPELHSMLFPQGKSEFRFPEPPYKAYYILLCRVIIGYHVSVTCTDAATKTLINNYAEGRDIFADKNDRELAFIPNLDSKATTRYTQDSEIRYHCLVAKKAGVIIRFREFCQFHGNRVYPEYLLCYKRK